MSVFRLRRTRAAAWSPSMIPRSLMFGWLDAEKTETVAQAGGAVSSWVDAITGTAFVQATEASKPGYSAAGFNGRPCLTFDGAADHLAYTAGAIAWPDSGAFELWALVDQQEAGGSNATRQIIGWPNVGAGGLTLGRPNGVSLEGNRLRAIIGNGSTTVNADAGLGIFSGPSVVRLRCDGLVATAHLNGMAGPPIPVVPSFSGATRYRIGAAQGSSPSQFWKGSINCLLVTALLDDRWAAPLSMHLAARRGV